MSITQGFTGNWSEIPQMYPVHGAATTFYRGKFWVLGGSTGKDDKIFSCSLILIVKVMTAMIIQSLTRSKLIILKRKNGVLRLNIKFSLNSLPGLI